MTAPAATPTRVNAMVAPAKAQPFPRASLTLWHPHSLEVPCLRHVVYREGHVGQRLMTPKLHPIHYPPFLREDRVDGKVDVPVFFTNALRPDGLPFPVFGEVRHPSALGRRSVTQRRVVVTQDVGLLTWRLPRHRKPFPEESDVAIITLRASLNRPSRDDDAALPCAAENDPVARRKLAVTHRAGAQRPMRARPRSRRLAARGSSGGFRHRRSLP
jgi:hypothetical protein